MTFKAVWEKASENHKFPEGLILKMLKKACPSQTLSSYALIPGGCANLIYKVFFEEDPRPYALRICLRNDKETLLREQKLSTLLKNDLPVPEIFYGGETEGYPFSLAQWLPGIPLRDLLLGEYSYPLEDIMEDVGAMLSKLSNYTFPQSGFFDKDLNVPRSFEDDFALTFAKKCLGDHAVEVALAPEIRTKIERLFTTHQYLLKDPDNRHLVHGDFDPANILVDCVEGRWEITGLLDFEFAFSGSILQDVANMLRYAHKMPDGFQRGFLKGLEKSGVSLPVNWPISIHLLNLLSLLDLLTRTNPQTQSVRYRDIMTLFLDILERHRREGF